MTESKVRGNVEHGEGGKFKDKYSDDDVVDALLEAHPEPLTNKEVAQRVGCSKPTAHNRLHELAEDDRVLTKKVGANARVWWVEG
ncbi:helix-turn-helix domain-containing protein [Natronosalvus rutilus]|uniref:Helix-turn-helix domain-containing protein n=1 Tax=Natronosalvus rutilus TaxID=2953753 RepID=A0A9E7NEP0_9EURY|nr:helix-turn-helix domain-containing protein [Natronosalvus rutilus]UTF55956.1 helix-turn-helix domain-containing protein [Natronosalvus rutilus]